MNFLHTYLPSSVLADFGFLTIKWYGVLLALGVLFGYLLARKLAKRKGENLDEFDTTVAWLIVGGVVGARLLDVFFYEWWYFHSHFGEVFKFWEGGLSFYGGLIGGAIVLALRVRKISTILRWGDFLAPGLALGQAIGRWGNYFNQEIFGSPTKLPWGIPIAPAFRPDDYLEFTYFHPVFLYESLGLLVLALFLWRYLKSTRAPGTCLAIYLIAGGVFRFALELLRVDDQSVWLGIKAGYWVATIIILAGGFLWLFIKNTSAKKQVV